MRLSKHSKSFEFSLHSKLVHFLFESILSIDTKAAADKYKWQENLHRSKTQRRKRGRAKIAIEELNAELHMKEETVERMRSSLNRLKKRTKDETITESDLEEFDELLSTDDEDESDGK